jgi:GNAT superfamily N-acetyltransferase
MPLPEPLSHRRAGEADAPALEMLMARAIEQLQQGLLSPAQITASAALMGLDRQLIADGTYFVVEDGARLVGCGGWSARATHFGGDHTSGRDPRLLDPATEAARIRAMYTDPEYVRRGIGRFILELAEREAVAAGFARLELTATLAGLPLYRSYGFADVQAFNATAPNGISVPMIVMSKVVR